MDKFTKDIEAMKAYVETVVERQNDFEGKFTFCLNEVNKLNQMDQKERIDNFQRRMLRSVFNEFWTPLERKMNVDIKELKKHTEESMLINKEHHLMLFKHAAEIEKINSSILRTLKNTNNENKMLDREIERM